jgi:sugar lactone lactonase YvrE
VACGIGQFAVDTLEQKIYFYVAGGDKIARANLDGSNQEDVLTLGGALPTSMAIDEPGRKLYWTFGLGIMRANLDGSSVETVVAGSTASRGLSVDSAGGKMYWTDESPTRLSRANLDGSGLENLIGALPPVVFTSTTLDLDSGKVYWIADSGIRFIDLDGSNADSIPVAFNNPTGIAFESDSGRLYLTKFDPIPPFVGEIVRINIDGSGFTTILSGLASPSFIAIAEDIDDDVPAVSAWGLAILVLFLLAASAVFLRARRMRGTC